MVSRSREVMGWARVRWAVAVAAAFGVGAGTALGSLGVAGALGLPAWWPGFLAWSWLAVLGLVAAGLILSVMADVEAGWSGAGRDVSAVELAAGR